jgi:hypothetical protein
MAVTLIITVASVAGRPGLYAADLLHVISREPMLAGDRCWGLDAMDPNALRDRVEQEIIRLIEPVAWARCAIVNRAEQESLRTIIEKWGAA